MVLPHDIERASDTDGRITACYNTDHHRQGKGRYARKAVNLADNKYGSNRGERASCRIERTSKGLVDAGIDQNRIRRFGP